MDNIFDIFHDRIIAAIRTGEVICLFFPRLGKTVIVDLRHNDVAPPAVFVEAMVGSPEERLKSLERLRPDWPLPEEVRLAPWFGFVGSLQESEICAVLLERCEQAGGAEFVERCRAALDELRAFEAQYVRGVIRGELSRVVWQRPRA
jgi:hypothetical protein